MICNCFNRFNYKSCFSLENDKKVNDLLRKSVSTNPGFDKKRPTKKGAG